MFHVEHFLFVISLRIALFVISLGILYLCGIKIPNGMTKKFCGLVIGVILRYFCKILGMMNDE